MSVLGSYLTVTLLRYYGWSVPVIFRRHCLKQQISWSSKLTFSGNKWNFKSYLVVYLPQGRLALNLSFFLSFPSPFWSFFSFSVFVLSLSLLLTSFFLLLHRKSKLTSKGTGVGVSKHRETRKSGGHEKGRSPQGLTESLTIRAARIQHSIGYKGCPESTDFIPFVYPYVLS